MYVASAFLGWVLPYVAVAVFVLGMAYRLLAWANTPLPFKLTLFPVANTYSGAVADVVAEVVLFRSLWRGIKALWAGAWIFHAALALCLIGHIFGIAFTSHHFVLLGFSAEQSEKLSALFGSVAGLVLLATILYLGLRRLAVPHLRYISAAGDYLMLALLLGIVLTGNYMRFVSEVELTQVRAFIGGLLTFRPGALPENPVFLVHFSLVQLLLLYFPFSKLVHSCGIFFTRWIAGRPCERQEVWK